MPTSLARRLMLLSGWRQWSVAAIAGAVSALGLAPVDAAPVLFLTLPVLVFLIDGIAASGPAHRGDLVRSALVGWWFGFGYFLASLNWIGAAFLVDGLGLAPLIPVAIAGLAAGLALFTAVGTLVARLLWSDGAARLAALAFGLGLSEWLRGHVLTGFPWNLFGQSAAFTDITAQIVSLVGIYGLTVMAVALFAAPVVALADGPGRARRWALAAAAVLLLVDLGYGALRLGPAGPAETADSAGPRVRVVQPNIDQSQKWSPEHREATIERLTALSAPADDDGGFRLLVWPETAVPFFLTEEPGVLERIGSVLPPGAVLLTGAPRVVPTADGRKYYNSVFAVDRDGEVIGSYDKVHLVPFGEYLPFEHWMNSLGLKQIVHNVGGFSAGENRPPLRLPGLPATGVLICYEAIFSGATVERNAERPGLLVNVTNDGWFGQSAGPFQHLDQARLRAIEEGLPVVRAANTGISAIIDAYGRYVSRLTLATAGILDGPIPEALPPTPFAVEGPAILAGIFGICFAIAFAGHRKRRRGS